jgi:hypothetical protein
MEPGAHLTMSELAHSVNHGTAMEITENEKNPVSELGQCEERA